MRRPAATLAAALVAIGALSACGGGEKDPVASAPKVSSAANSAISSAASAASAASSAGASASSAVASIADEASAEASPTAADMDTMSDAQATCEFLATIYPTLAAVGSPAGALAQLASGYFAFVSTRPGGKLPDAAELDAITSKECPAVRKDVLKVLDAEQFAGTL